ncbi:MAG: hypothetical protein LUC49_05785 [Prevotella sp.]|nr:hypothetical protein [Prevotella sp.]MCD8306148.1 hypothetical protein [Prevotella sp.]
MARSFFGSLARGFVRSAVNQVGRDSGRVVSNSIYGDKHAIPVRHVGSAAEVIEENGLQPDADGVVAVARPDLNVGNFRMFIYLIVGVPFAPIGTALLLYNGIKRLRRKTIKVKRYVIKDIYTPAATPDNAGNERYDGRQEYIEKVPVPKTDHDTAVDKRVGTIYLIAGIVSAVGYIVGCCMLG